MRMPRMKEALRTFFSACVIALVVCASVAAPAFAASFEENKASATDLSLNKTESVTFSFARNEWLHIRLTQSGVLQFTVSLPKSLDFQVWGSGDLYDSSGEKLWEGLTYMVGETVTSEQSTRVPLAPGDYYFLVSCTGFTGTLNLNLRADFTPTTNWETENNNTLAKADAIPLNTTIQGECDAATLSDWFTFTLPQRGTVALTVTPTEGRFGGYLYLTDGSGNDGIIRMMNIGSFTGTIKTPRIGLDAGTYAIRIERGSYPMGAPAGYSVRVDYTQTGDWEVELNDNWKTATPASLGKTVKGSIVRGQGTDLDKYSFTLSKGTDVTFALSNLTTPGGSMSLRVETLGGKEIETYRFGKRNESDPIALDAGTYVMTVSGSQNCEYSLTVKDAAASARTMYRLYNKWSGEHLYTADASERDKLVKLGWTSEGEGWTAPASGDPVYRLYNPYAPQGDHHYTMSKTEYDTLVRAGWKGEGVAWYSAPKTGTPLYRLFNPYAQSCTHHYTTDAGERDALVKAGWRAEGIAWYGL
ncbi:hypothetical protein [Thermophilibacter provencensis]|uniref:DUF5648 domain-containing protein n=1 Tax=Thermophilibacter provencensis TaxID=1852386 RepID=A0ABT7V5Q8_9ACTN|nr:hypothetical protein [Thermophilibacter provencensis]MDM8271937.1 hypothetical protein [Thermophilibacter provencensis]